MVRTKQRAAGSLSFLALAILAIAIAFARSAPASGATHATPKRATHGKANHRCLPDPGHHKAKRKQKRLVRVHASRERQHHRRLSRCASHDSRKRVATHRGTTAPKGSAKSLSPSNPAVSPYPQTTWAAVGTPPLSDAQAAALVTHVPENRPTNAPANEYVPTTSELAAFHSAQNVGGESILESNPLNAYVDGLDGLSKPSTGDLIDWAAHKWGIPEDWLKAEYVEESRWYQSVLGDKTKVSPEWYAAYPAAARIAPSSVYESMGITQVKWMPDNSQFPGTEPLRWQSTSFNIDFQAAQIRYYYDGYCTWCAPGYTAGQAWNSIGAWDSPNPWGNAYQKEYITWVQEYLAEKPWLSSSF